METHAIEIKITNKSLLQKKTKYRPSSVNLEIFARINFRETSHMRSFAKIKPPQIGDITLSFTDIGKSCPVRDFFTSQMCFNAIRENFRIYSISHLNWVHTSWDLFKPFADFNIYM